MTKQKQNKMTNKLKLTQQEQTDTILELVKHEKRKELSLWILIIFIQIALLTFLFIYF